MIDSFARPIETYSPTRLPRVAAAFFCAAALAFATRPTFAQDAAAPPADATTPSDAEIMRAERLETLFRDARAAFARGDHERALALAAEAATLAPDEPRVHAFRGSLHTSLRKHEAAIADFDRLVALRPDDADAYDLRGAARFCAGRVGESVADFDRAVELDPARGPGHWRRGISYYFAGEFDAGREQFERYQKVDDSDVENAVWRFLCMARKDGLEKARAEILKIGDDRRVPMRGIYELFAGRGAPDDVLAACRAGEPDERELNERLFYAEQYLGLHAEARGDHAAARKHMEAAVAHPIRHYMYDVAVVHLARLKATDSPTKEPATPDAK